jgi:hypothetical protein
VCEKEWQPPSLRRNVKPSPLASQKLNYIRRTGQKKHFYSRLLNPFFVRRALIRCSTPRACPRPRGCSGHAGHNEKRGELPHVGEYLHKSLIRVFFSRHSFLPAPPTPPSPLDLLAVSASDLLRVSTVVAAGSLNAAPNPPHLRAYKVLDDLPGRRDWPLFVELSASAQF